MHFSIHTVMIASMFGLAALDSCGTAHTQSPINLSITSPLMLPVIPSMPLSQFQSSLGVVVHIEYTDGKYADSHQVLADLKYLGVQYVRDGIPNPHWQPAGQGLAAMQYLAQNGIQFDFLTACNDYTLTSMMTQLDSLESQFPGIAASVEGTNEINNQPCTIGGGTNEQNAEAWQKSVYTAIHADSLTKNVPVLYMTGAAPKSNLTGLADQAATHPYPNLGVQPHARMMSDFLTEFPGIAATVTKQITETGYATDTADNSSAVDEPTQESLGLNIFFDSALQGISRTFLYQLLEAYPTPSGDTSLGLFHYDGSPKMVATGLHNLLGLIPKDASSLPKRVQAVVSGLPTTAYKLALTASDGSIYLFTWNEVPLWDATHMTELPSTPVRYSVQMTGKWTAEYLDPKLNQMTKVATANGGFYAMAQPYPTALHLVPQN